MRTRAFTTVELFLAIAWLATVALLTFPNLLVEERNERSARALGALKHLAAAQGLYRAERGVYTDLAGLHRAGLIDDVLVSGTRCGYSFEAAPSTTTPELLWRAAAHPLHGGDRPFAIDHRGVLHYAQPGLEVRLAADTCELPADLVEVGR